MNSQTADELRQSFLDFFAEREHRIVPSGPLVPPNDPTLMFANAGMVQFKDVFTGREQRDYSRATSSQKCIRISGKHNDLEAVGPSPRHHTFFEMLGNFSFGDYFKEAAILYAWQFITDVLDLPRERIVCTYFAGEDGVPADTEARDYWKKISGLPDDRIIGLGKDENFWQMGDTGPCGPSSEIHYYIGPEPEGRPFDGQQQPDGTGWMEIWNLVFMQFERDDAGKLSDLPAPSIDTGAGLERLASVIQGKQTNYDCDLLRGLLEFIADIAKKPYGGSMAPDDVSMRVIADHARTTAFMVSEGILPDRNAREYVLRRVMRRAVRHGHRLGIEEPFLHRAAGKVIDLMGHHYGQLREKRELIENVAEQEEVRFRATIERGLALLDERFGTMEARGEKRLPGRDAFQLYDTYGFPLDLTEVICSERGYTVDKDGYDAALEEAKERSQFKGREGAIDHVYRDALAKVPDGEVRFVGYERERASAKVLALIADGELRDRVEAGSDVEVVVGETPFYGEAGGQVGDAGMIVVAGDEPGATALVRDTTKPVAGLVVHRAKLERGALAVGDEVELRVDSERRDAVRRNHSATHLLHWALRKVVGQHAQQKGSLVGPDRLRFDFTHGSALAPEQLAEIEAMVNHAVLHNTPVQTEVLSMDEARDRGAMMIFEEKYGDTVRMLTIGPSTELCGGTHARATGDIGLFKITGEQGVAAGVRRILATTGEGSLGYVRELEGQLDRVARIAKAGGGDVSEKVEKLVATQKQLEKTIDELQRKLATGGGGGGGIDDMLGKARDVSGVKVLGVRTEVADRGALRELAEQLRDKLGDAVVLVGSESDGKAQLVLTVSKSLTDRLKAGVLIRSIAEIVGGSGGGRPDMAQAGGTDIDKLGEAIEAVYDRVAAA